VSRSYADHLLSLCERPRRYNATKHDLAGYGQMLAAMKFMRWAIEQKRFPTHESVMDRFNVCRATAYRWTLALAECYGVDPAIRHTFDRPRNIAAKATGGEP
jgi:hypothetical protein